MTRFSFGISSVRVDLVVNMETRQSCFIYLSTGTLISSGSLLCHHRHYRLRILGAGGSSEDCHHITDLVSRNARVQYIAYNRAAEPSDLYYKTYHAHGESCTALLTQDLYSMKPVNDFLSLPKIIGIWRKPDYGVRRKRVIDLRR